MERLLLIRTDRHIEDDLAYGDKIVEFTENELLNIIGCCDPKSYPEEEFDETNEYWTKMNKIIKKIMEVL